MKVGRKSKQIIRDLMACKAQGICDRDGLVTMWVEQRMKTNNAVRESVIEAMREEMELPVCPPVCPQLIEGETV